jgi:hypothetical protein
MQRKDTCLHFKKTLNRILLSSLIHKRDNVSISLLGSEIISVFLEILKIELHNSKLSSDTRI